MDTHGPGGGGGGGTPDLLGFEEICVAIQLRQQRLLVAVPHQELRAACGSDPAGDLVSWGRGGPLVMRLCRVSRQQRFWDFDFVGTRETKTWIGNWSRHR